ncbi:conserved hypothetical protein [Rhodococcus phage E3]|uniref:hypothetical protein n=1 Tax=Rhodococcus phage E3 TaxID=1007869 RepID=UPI0002C6B787|nr:hypothetical protein M176_gp101 [Rhodococcus phage E3]AEQ21010.1 conserved hypothetical protein [Rhodococcus phage E3]
MTTFNPLAHLAPAQIDEQIAKRESNIARLQAQIEQEEALLKPLTDEYKARGGWTRAYLVNNADGHVHSTTGCNTCRWTTQFQWLTSLSGQSQDEIVAAAGELACTVCYPDAPVEVTSKPGTLRTDHQVAQEQRAKEKAERDAEKASKEVRSPETGKILFKTQRAAEIELVTSLADLSDALFQLNSQPERAGFWVQAIDEREAKARSIAAALEAKTGENPIEASIAKAEAKIIKSVKDFNKHDAARLRLDPASVPAKGSIVARLTEYLG